MQKEENKYFLLALLLYIFLILLIYSGTYIKLLFQFSWIGNASVIAIIFIWVTIFIIATIAASKGFFIVKTRLQGKERLDFLAKLGALIIEKNTDKKMDLFEFFDIICKENGVYKIPDLQKYYINTFKREEILKLLREEIESAADLKTKVKV